MGIFRKKHIVYPEYAVIEGSDGRTVKIPVGDWFTVFAPLRLGGDIDDDTRVDIITNVKIRLKVTYE